MTIDEAIQHALEVAAYSCGDCSKNHRQLAAWLTKLKKLKESEELGMRNEELKPCPFCGCEAELIPYSLETGDNLKYWAVTCSNRDCFVQPETPYYHKEDAIEAWNFRV